MKDVARHHSLASDLLRELLYDFLSPDGANRHLQTVLTDPDTFQTQFAQFLGSGDPRSRGDAEQAFNKLVFGVKKVVPIVGKMQVSGKLVLTIKLQWFG